MKEQETIHGVTPLRVLKHTGYRKWMKYFAFNGRNNFHFYETI